MKNNLDDLYGYVFLYNPYEKLWYAVTKETYIFFAGGYKEKSVFYKSKDHSTLVEILINDDLLKKLSNDSGTTDKKYHK